MHPLNVKYASMQLKITFSIPKVRVLAQDGGSPQRSATSTVLITVTRNLNAPQLLQQNYTVSIYETQNLGESILQIQATDQDISVSVLFFAHYYFSSLTSVIMKSFCYVVSRDFSVFGVLF